MGLDWHLKKASGCRVLLIKLILKVTPGQHGRADVWAHSFGYIFFWTSISLLVKLWEVTSTGFGEISKELTIHCGHWSL